MENQLIIAIIGTATALLAGIISIIIAAIRANGKIKKLIELLGIEKDGKSITGQISDTDKLIKNQLGVEDGDRNITKQIGLSIDDKPIIGQIKDMRTPINTIVNFIKDEKEKEEILNEINVDNKSIKEGMDILNAVVTQYTNLSKKLDILQTILEEKNKEIIELKNS